MIKILDNKEDFEKIVGEGNVVVDFFAVWCGPCRFMGQVIEGLEADYPNVTFLKIDVDKFPEIAAKYGVSSIPNLFFFQNGEQVKIFVDGEMKTDLLGARHDDDFRMILDTTFGK